jgi:hypothetical protein
MSFGEVGILRRDYDNPIPEFLLTLVIAQPLGHDIGLTDIAASVADGFFVVTQQEVNTGVLGLLAYKKIREVRTARR